MHPPHQFTRCDFAHMEGLMASSQTRAIQNYGSRLGDRGLARFEVLGRDSDRSLIRSLARRLAEMAQRRRTLAQL